MFFNQMKRGVFFMLLFVLVLGLTANSTVLARSTETAVSQQPIITTTASNIPLAPPPAPISTSATLPITTQTAESESLINLDTFRADARFAGIDGSGYAIVIIDTGIDLDHPYFGPDGDGDGVADRIVYHEDFADGDLDATDVNGHGSNVSSIAAGSDVAYTGMAPGADIIHLKVFEDSGAGYFSYVEAALQWVVANAATYNIVSVNMSLGDSGNYTSAQTLYGIDDEMQSLKDAGVVVVSSSGNSFSSFGSAQGVGYPSADSSSFSIGAVYDSDAGGFIYSSGAQAFTTDADRLTPFSQRDQNLSTVFAPGAPITGAGPTGGTTEFHGTSQAAPHVAGIVALLQQLADQELGRTLEVTEVYDLIKDTSVLINDGDDEDDNVVNTGLDFQRIDVFALGERLLTAHFCQDRLVTIEGTSGDDIIDGTPGRDVIHGFQGNDTIYGHGAGDIICAGTGDDTVLGGGGPDKIRGGAGDDLLVGGGGDDLLLGLWGDDDLFGGNGEDTLDGGTNTDFCDGGADVDTLEATCETAVNP